MVRREVPLPRDREGRLRTADLLRAIRQLVQVFRDERGDAAGRRLQEVGLRPAAQRGVVEVVLHFK